MPPDRIAGELRVLQALCQGTPQGSVLETAKSMLQHYRWREPVHQVVYEARLSIPGDDPQIIREQLPSRVARRGFPDCPWDELFAPCSLSKAEIERLLRELRDGE